MPLFLRDLRKGMGCKQLSRYILINLYNYVPEIVQSLIPVYAEYGYWKDYNLMIADLYNYEEYWPIIDNIYDIISDQLQRDYDASLDLNNVTNLCKYVPKEKGYYNKCYGCSYQLANRLYPMEYNRDVKAGMRKYRHLCSYLNQYYNKSELAINIEKNKEHFSSLTTVCLDGTVSSMY